MFRTRGLIFRKTAVYTVLYIVCFTCISISNHVDRRVCMNTLFYLQLQSCRSKSVHEHTLLPTVAVL